MIEFKNGDKCIWNGAEYIFVGLVYGEGGYISAHISKQPEIKTVMLEYLTKPMSDEEKAAKDIYDLYAECWGGVSLHAWDDAPPVTKKVWIEMASKIKIK